MDPERKHYHPADTADRRLAGNDSLDPDEPVGDAAYYRAISHAADAGLLVESMDGRILWANQAYADMMAMPLADIIGRNPLSFALAPEETPTDEEIAQFRHQPGPNGGPQVSIFQNVRGNGEKFWIELHFSFDFSREFGEIAILVARDISDHINRQQELSATTAKLSHLAATDNLTGLANRMHIMAKLKQALSVQEKNPGNVGLLVVDLDHFKAINDSYGHSAGDAILCKVAETLKRAIAPGDIAARIGGDEFLILCHGVSSLDEIERLGQRILALNSDTISIDDIALTCNLSIGAAISDDTSAGPEQLLKRSDFALYEAKNNGRGIIATYDSALHARYVDETELADELRDAIDNDELTFQFQPTMLLDTGEVRGFETLVRWYNPRRGQIAPVDFLPMAKTLGLMSKIDFAALEAALNLKEELNKCGYLNIKVGFNGSAELLGHPQFYSRLMSGLTKRTLRPADVVIEVLETVVFDDVTQSNPLVQTVQQLHDAGFPTLLDDFGTGHAGLTHLATLAVTGVKIDRTLTRNVLTDPTSAKIISMMYELCRDLDLGVITEGVETLDQAHALSKMGGTLIQGFWLAQAMPSYDVMHWLATREDITDPITRSAIAAAPGPGY